MSEHQEQVSFFDWVRLNRLCGSSEVKKAMELCYAIPNGGARNVIIGKKLKDEGVEKGMPDINLDCPVIKPESRNNGCFKGAEDIICGLRIEMKFGKNTLTLEQKRKKELLEEAGFKVEVCYSASEAVKAVFEYLPFKANDYQGIKEFVC